MDNIYKDIKKCFDKNFDGEEQIVIGCTDSEGELKKLIAYIANNGNKGHSFKITVDPTDSEYKRDFYWDGDGSDQIYSMNGQKIDKWFKTLKK